MDWREKLGNLKQELPEGENTDNSSAEQQQVKGNSLQKDPLRIELDKRNGKPTTLITEYQGSEDELKELARVLKQKCSSGGSARGGEILIQGDFRQRIADLLVQMGYKVKRINFK